MGLREFRPESADQRESFITLINPPLISFASVIATRLRNRAGGGADRVSDDENVWQRVR